MAVLNYHDVHGHFPPAYTVDADGNRLHSWRTLLLLYVEEEGLYAQIDLTKPWDDPANAAVFSTPVDVFACPDATYPDGMTTYLAVVGPGFAFTGADATRRADVTDGASDTAWLIDAPSDQAVPWMAPWDADEATFLAINESTPARRHDEGVMVGFLDNAARWLAFDLDRATRRALLTIAGGEQLQLEH